MITTTHITKRARRGAALAAVLAIALWQTAAAQDSQGVTIEADKCVAFEKPEERLACFEAEVEAARQRAAAPRGGEPAEPSTGPVERGGPAAPSAVPADGGEPAAASSVGTVDIPAAADDRPGRRRAGRAEEPQTEIVAKVVALRETVPNAYVITLDNGQVWRQSPPEAYPLRVGSEVRIRSSNWGWRLTAPERRGQIGVERVR